MLNRPAFFSSSVMCKPVTQRHLCIMRARVRQSTKKADGTLLTEEVYFDERSEVVSYPKMLVCASVLLLLIQKLKLSYRAQFIHSVVKTARVTT